MENKVQPPDNSDDSLDKIRQLIVGQDEKYVQQIMRRDAKGLVSGVVSEALHEREIADGSVNKVLVPLVEKSLHRSIEANSEKIVGTLYPLVGSLVRRAVSAFLVDFVERTNALIENSFSPKSIAWRFQAWQSGVRYSEFVASQIYQYQVQQLFVIHRETGTLLHTLSSDPERTKDADLISSMLVAINDFVADSFSSSTANEAENELGEIKTGDFTLLIKLGPQAILVAAVVGSVPPDIRRKLQQALEEFHQFYQLPLQEYQGDNSAFTGCETLLNDCLISGKKEDAPIKKKRWAGGIVILLGLCFLGYLAFLRIEISMVHNTIETLPAPSGIVITDATIQDGKVHVRLLRDPFMQSSHEWLQSQDIDVEKVVLHEEPFVSLRKEVIRKKIVHLISLVPSVSISSETQNSIFLSGKPSIDEVDNLHRSLDAIPGVSQFHLDTANIQITTPNIDRKTLTLASLKQLAAQVSATKITFASNQEDLNSSQQSGLKRLALQLTQLQEMANQLNVSVAVFILGASDNSGTTARNLALSQKRADNVVSALIAMNVDPKLISAMGLGQLSLSEPSMGRSVLINVLISDTLAQGVNKQ